MAVHFEVFYELIFVENCKNIFVENGIVGFEPKGSGMFWGVPKPKNAKVPKNAILHKKCQNVEMLQMD
jgi:hypothetical protein